MGIHERDESFKKKDQQAGIAAAELQEFFYLVHHQIGMAREDALRHGKEIDNDVLPHISSCRSGM